MARPAPRWQLSADWGWAAWGGAAADWEGLRPAFLSNRELAVGAVMGIPFELGAFLFGVLAPWTAIVVRGSPTCRTVGSGRLELVGEAMAGHFPSEWTAQGLVWQVCVCVCA